jgi:hypothetical protein
MMARSVVEVLAREMDAAWLWLCESLDGLTDDEYVWRPTADTLTLASNRIGGLAHLLRQVSQSPAPLHDRAQDRSRGDLQAHVRGICLSRGPAELAME